MSFTPVHDPVDCHHERGNEVALFVKKIFNDETQRWEEAEFNAKTQHWEPTGRKWPEPGPHYAVVAAELGMAPDENGDYDYELIDDLLDGYTTRREKKAGVRVERYDLHALLPKEV